LKTVFLPKRLLQRMQLINRSKGLHRKNQARPNSDTIYNDSAGATDAMLAAHVSAVQMQVVP
jgi:hypothetical protein